MTPRQAKKTVLEKYPEVARWLADSGECQLCVESANGELELTGWMKSENAAWIEAARKVLGEVPPPLAKQAWEIAGKVEWTTDDWMEFYQSLTAAFLRISARHAKRKIETKPNS